MSIRNFGMQMVFGLGYNEAQPYIPHKTQTQKCEEKYLNKKNYRKLSTDCGICERQPDKLKQSRRKRKNSPHKPSKNIAINKCNLPKVNGNKSALR